jgi:hypothetical protein
VRAGHRPASLSAAQIAKRGRVEVGFVLMQRCCAVPVRRVVRGPVLEQPDDAGLLPAPLRTDLRDDRRRVGARSRSVWKRSNCAGDADVIGDRAAGAAACPSR